MLAGTAAAAGGSPSSALDVPARANPRFNSESTGGHRVEHIEKGVRPPRFGVALTHGQQESGVEYPGAGRQERRDPSG